MAKMSKGEVQLKTYRVYYRAELEGHRDVEAFDPDDAEEQVGGLMDISDFQDTDGINGEVTEVHLIEPEKKAGKRRR